MFSPVLALDDFVSAEGLEALRNNTITQSFEGNQWAVQSCRYS
jgi:hypothetical protein